VTNDARFLLWTDQELFLAAVGRRTPDPLEIPAPLSTAETIKSVARDFANTARRRLEDLTQTHPDNRGSATGVYPQRQGFAGRS